MRDGEIGRAIRALRLRRGWTQRQLAVRAGLSQRTVSRVEREPIEQQTVMVLRRIGEPLGLAIHLDGRWRGGELARLLDAGHASLQNATKVRLERWGWLVAAEVTFSSYGERGSYDLLAWHPATGILLVVEIKTVIADVQGLLRPIDIKLRLARSVARSLGWEPSAVVACLAAMDGMTARRRVAQHAALFAQFRLRGRAARAWLRMPDRGTAGGLLIFANPPSSRVAAIRRPGTQRIRRGARSASVEEASRPTSPRPNPVYQPPPG